MRAEVFQRAGSWGQPIDRLKELSTTELLKPLVVVERSLKIRLYGTRWNHAALFLGGRPIFGGPTFFSIRRKASILDLANATAASSWALRVFNIRLTSIFFLLVT